MFVAYMCRQIYLHIYVHNYIIWLPKLIAKYYVKTGANSRNAYSTSSIQFISPSVVEETKIPSKMT